MSRSPRFLRCVGPSLQGLKGSLVQSASPAFPTVVLDALAFLKPVITLTLLVPSQLLC